MASSYFKVKNGIQIGPFSVDADTGSISTTGSVTFGGDVNVSAITKNDSKIMINDTGTSSNVDIIVDGTRAVVFTGTAMLPNTDITYDLGSPDLQWRDVYVGPGSLYVNGQKVLQEESGNIVVSADADQNLVFQTSGSGNLELDPVGTGVVAIKGTLQIEGGTNVTSSDGNPVVFANGLKSDSLTSRSTNTDLTVTANGTGIVRVDDDLVITGNLTISGTTTTVNTATLSVADNIVDLNSDFTTGTPTQNSGLRVLRGDETAVQIRWNETTDKWQFTNDGSTYVDLGDVPTDLSGFNNDAGFITLTSLSAGTGVTYDNSTGAISIGQAVNTNSNVTFANITASTSANVGYLVIGSTGTSFGEAGDLYLGNGTSLLPNSNAGADIGSSGYRFATGYINIITTNNINVASGQFIANESGVSISGNAVLHAGNAGHNHSSVYVVTTANATANSSASLALTAATLGFDMTGAITYQVYLNRQLLRPTEVSVNTTNGTLTFSTGVVAADDEIEAVWLG